MRLILLIIFFLFSCLAFGQDTLQNDTTLITFNSAVQDSVAVDSTSFTFKSFSIKKKKQKKKVQEFKIKEEPNSTKEESSSDVNVSGKGYVPIIIGVLIIIVIICLVFSRSTFAAPDEQHNTTISKREGFLSDYLSRIFLSRRDYYRNVYLKSEEWNRKRYIVLKRDSWRCAYCGGQATQVHHIRYAKKNIGKEPIEWLVSICKTCHDSKHS